MITESIGQRVRRLRKERGWLIADLARLVHSNGTTITQLELGRHSTNMFTFIEIARAFDVSIDYLAYGIEYHGNTSNHVSEEPAATHAAGR